MSKLSILDVGHGNCAVLVDNDEVLVIDAGPNVTLLQFLEQQDINHINNIIVSHADADHIRGLLVLIGTEKIKIDKIYLNSDAEKDSDLWDDLLYLLDKSHRDNSITCQASIHANTTSALMCGNVNIEVLAPSFYLAGKGPGSTDRDGDVITSNSISAVIRLVSNGVPLAIFPGDIDGVGLKNLLATCTMPRAKIAVFPHHGGRPGQTSPRTFASEFINAIQPEIVIFSIGRGRFSNPQPEIIDGVFSASPHIRIACTQLSERCASVLPHVEYTHLTEDFASGRDKKLSCAGTLHIHFDSTSELEPLIKHRDFVVKNITNALCMKSPSTLLITDIPILAN